MLVFIHINKTGGTTVTHILRSSYGVRHCQVEPWHDRRTGPPFSARDLERLRRLYPNLKSIAGHRIVGYVDLGERSTDVRYFTFLRDPLKSTASRYQYKVQVSGQKDLAFEEWIHRDWNRNYQTKQIAGVGDVDEAIRVINDKNVFVGLAERFDESLMLLRAMVANDLNLSYLPVNVAHDRSIARGLLESESTRRSLVEAEKVDVELYEYVKRELFPTYERDYGPSLAADVARFQQSQSHDFDRRNLTFARLKHYLVYKPALGLSRRGIRLA